MQKSVEAFSWIISVEIGRNTVLVHWVIDVVKEYMEFCNWNWVGNACKDAILHVDIYVWK